MKGIPLTQGKVAIVDDDDYERLSGFSWTAMRSKNCWYAKRHTGSVTTLMHRDVLGDGCPPMVDHINCNGLDNRRENLRPCSSAQNAGNARKALTRRNRTSRFKGVSSNMGVSWSARIGNRQLGFFKHEVAAAIAYDCAAREHFGSFARLNFPYGAG